MQFTTNATLIGVVGKKGNGVMENGQQWATDRVELHVAVPFSESETMAHGQTVTTYPVQDFAAHYEKAKGLIGQNVTLQMTMEPSKKLGQAPKIICTGFYAELSPVRTKASSQPAV